MPIAATFLADIEEDRALTALILRANSQGASRQGDSDPGGGGGHRQDEVAVTNNIGTGGPTAGRIVTGDLKLV